VFVEGRHALGHNLGHNSAEQPDSPRVAAADFIIQVRPAVTPLDPVTISVRAVIQFFVRGQWTTSWDG